MPKLSQILQDLASVKIVLSTLVGLGGVIVAFTKPFGSPEVDQIVGLVLGAAAFGIVVISAYQKAFTAGKASLRRG
jgi:glucose uptake protein GlcU